MLFRTQMVRHWTEFPTTLKSVWFDALHELYMSQEYVGNLFPSERSAIQNQSLYGRIHIIISRNRLYTSIHIDGSQSVKQLTLKNPSGHVLQTISSEDAELNSPNKACFESVLTSSMLERSFHDLEVMADVSLNSSAQLEGYLVPYEKFSEVPFITSLNANGKLESSYIRGGLVGLQPNSFGNRISNKPFMKSFDWYEPRAAHLRWMVRGILFVTIEPRSVHKSMYQPEAALTDFFTVLSGGELSPSLASSASGFISLSIDTKAKIHFKAIGRSVAKAEKIDLVAMSSKDVFIKKLGTVSRRADEEDFEITGTWERPSADAIRLVFNGGFYIKIISQVEPKGFMAGRVRQFLYSPAADYSKGSILSVHDVSHSVKTKLSATALLTADANCNLHYIITIGGYGESSSAYRMIEGKLTLDAAYSRRRSKTIKLADFNKNYISRGSFIKPSDDMLNGVASSMAHVQINTRRFATGELKGQISLAGSTCNRIRGMRRGGLLQRSIVSGDGNFGVCLHGGRFHDHGAKWHPMAKDGSSKLYCKTCKCKNRVVTCKDIICPKPKCLNPEFVLENCCPVCPGPPNGKNVDPAKACIIGMASRSEIRAIGEAWHPMMPPFGMVKCVICICKSAPGGYTCRRIRCPELSCKNPQKTPGGCCPTCPKASELPKDTSKVKPMPKDITTSRRKKQSCTYNGSSYSHGTSWKPILPQFGILRCVICRCRALQDAQIEELKLKWPFGLDSKTPFIALRTMKFLKSSI
eukprot:gene18632-20514_t